MSMLAKSGILSLSISERIQIAEDIWDSVAETPDAVPMTDAKRSALDERLEAYHESPEAGVSWEAARERFRNPT